MRRDGGAPLAAGMTTKETQDYSRQYRQHAAGRVEGVSLSATFALRALSSSALW